MCEPTTIALFAGAALSAGGAYMQVDGQKKMATYQAQVAENNRKTAEWQAADAQDRGNTAAMATRRKYAAMQGTQRASLAARGLDISEGSADAILADTEFFGEIDQNTVRANAAREAWGYKVQAGNFENNAAALNAQADGMNPLLSGAMAGAGSYLSNARGVNPKWFGKPAGGTDSRYLYSNLGSGD
jgi:hypothetical protein